MPELIELATTTSDASSVSQQRSGGVAGKKEFAEIATRNLKARLIHTSRASFHPAHIYFQFFLWDFHLFLKRWFGRDG
jgi:hypothetical protein